MQAFVHATVEQRRLQKHIATLSARLALCGFQLQRLADGSWLIHNHAMSRVCDGLHEVAALVDVMEDRA